MIRFKTTILQFKEMGEKTGWTYIKVPAALAQELKPDNKKSFRVKGKLDAHAVSGLAMIPMGGGDFIIALNAAIRKAIHKQKGATVQAELEIDSKVIVPPKDLLECLADEPRALEFFRSLPKSHQNYYGNWVKAAKTEGTRARRIARIVDAMLKKQTYGEMLRAYRDDREEFSK